MSDMYPVLINPTKLRLLQTSKVRKEGKFKDKKNRTSHSESMSKNFQSEDDVEVEMNSGMRARHGRVAHMRLVYNQRSMHDMQNAWRQVNEYRHDESAEYRGRVRRKKENQ